MTTLTLGLAQIKTKLGDIETLVSFPSDKTPSQDDVKKLKDLASQLTQDISNKKDGK